MKYSPGPWSLDTKTGSICWGDTETMGKGGFVVGSHGVSRIPREQSERLTDEHHANARLIAAAPEMLEALKQTQNAPWVHNCAITNDIEALRAICLAYANWNNKILLPLLAKIDGAA